MVIKLLDENQNIYEWQSAWSTTSTSVNSISSNESITIIHKIDPISIDKIIVDGKTINFNKPIEFEVRYDDLIPGNYYVEDDFIYVHESSPNLEELKEKVEEALEIQWEDIVMEDDSKLSEDAIKLKQYLLSFT